MRLSVILPIMVLSLCGALLMVAGSGAAPVESAARPRTGMGMLQAYDCHRAETKVVLVRGKEDNFSPEGLEPIFLRPGRDNVRVASMVRGGSYDQSQADRGFTDSFRIPGRIAKGLLVLSLRPVGSNKTDPIAIGDLESASGRLLFTKGVPKLGEGDGWIVEGPFHSVELGQVQLNRPLPTDPARTLLDEFGGRTADSWLDVYLQDDTSVDFMGLAVCVKPPEGKGVTLAVRPAASERDDGVISLSCIYGTDESPVCDAVRGDTTCRTALPVACLRPDQIPAPRSSFSIWDRLNWTASDIALTAPVSAAGFGSIGDVDRYCVQQHGKGWRTAAMHDGGRAIGIAGRGRGSRVPTRAWVDIVDQPYGTCWTR